MSKKSKTWKAIKESDLDWQLDGESVLRAAIEPSRPKAKEVATVRITHSNTYGPLTGADLYLRVGNPARPTAQDDLDSATDWIKASLVEELVWVDEKEILRSDAQEPFDGETPWWGTYEAPLSFPPGKHSIEIKIVSEDPELLTSAVLSGWEITVR